MLQSFLSKIIQKRNRLKVLSYRRYGENGKNMFVFLALFTLLRAAELVLSRWKFPTPSSKTAQATIGLRSRHIIYPWLIRFVSRKASECRWRPRRYQVDPWSRGREDARGVLRSSPKPEKRPVFCRRRGIEKLCRLFFRQPRPNVFVSDVWPAPATYHRSFCEHSVSYTHLTLPTILLV